ncbi:MAG TPA: AMP-binding protein [Chryseolinea sp.]|nr:AMP-binding protein [Chryseolinea sp.]
MKTLFRVIPDSLVIMKDFPWYKLYPEGVEKEPKLYEYSSLADLINQACAKYGDRIAFENMGVTLSYRHLDKLANDFAAFLQNDLGLKKGERIAIQMPNLLQFPVVFIGAVRAGLIVVNTNPLYTAREMDHQFRDAEITALVIVANFAHNLEKVPYLSSIKHIIITELGDMLGSLKGAMVNFVVKRIKKLVPAYNLPQAIRFKDAMRKGANSQFKAVPLELADLAILQYTGGTTGIAKGAQLSHGNLVAHNAIVVQWFKPYTSASDDNTILTALPLYHIFALTVNGMLMFSTGVRNLLITNARDIPGLVKELKTHRVTIITAVNTLFNGLMNNAQFKEVDFGPLHGSVAGGMALQDAVAKKWETTTGKPIVEGYGLSETSPAICCNPLNGKHRLGTIGLPLPATELGIYDEEGKKLAQGETGEICVRGPQVMSGYWRSDNAGVFFEGQWFRTGDIGFMDPDGFFKIIDRKKDMIKVSGFNVFPNEIENVVAGHPKVLEVAAIGVPDEKSGETIKIFVVKRDESLTENELMIYCRENLTKYKVPRHVEFRKELPKSNVGKILRRPLREEEMKK